MVRVFPVSLIATFSLIGYVASVNAADESPKTLLGFVKPGMYAAIRSQVNSEAVQIEFCSKEAFLLAKAVMDRNKEFADQPQASAPEAAVVFVDPSVSLCQILHVGDDYILILALSPDGEKQQQVIASRFVSKIRWPRELNVIKSIPKQPPPFDIKIGLPSESPSTSR